MAGVPRTDAARFWQAVFRHDKAGLAADVEGDPDFTWFFLRELAHGRFPDADVDEVARYARELCQRGPLGVRPVQARVAEALVRHALGETYILDGLPPEEVGLVCTSLIYDLVTSMGWTQQVDRFLIAAETSAAARNAGEGRA